MAYFKSTIIKLEIALIKVSMLLTVKEIVRNTITKDIKIICSLNNSEKKAKSGKTLLFFDIATSPEKPTIKTIGIITIKEIIVRLF